VRYNLDMANRQPIEVGEWYHCYNRGVDKRKVFLEERDYERMLLLMYLSKYQKPVQLFNEDDLRLKAILSGAADSKSNPIAEVGAYALMPTHFHFVLREIVEGGIALFMQKVFTGYTMYFNRKNTRTGALFAGTFKSIHIADDRYLKHLVSYVHLNPAELIESDWKTSRKNIERLKNRLREYEYSSLPDFIGDPRPQTSIIDSSIFQLFDSMPSIRQMVMGAKVYGNLNEIEV